jgi:hypothetical protein
LIRSLPCAMNNKKIIWPSVCPIKHRHAKKEWTPQVESSLPEQKVLARRHLRYELKQLGVVAERTEVAVFVLPHHTRMIANQDDSVYFTRCSAAYAVYREDQWQRRSKRTELES